MLLISLPFYECSIMLQGTLVQAVIPCSVTIHECSGKGLKKTNSFEITFLLYFYPYSFFIVYTISSNSEAELGIKRSGVFLNNHVKGLVCYWMFLKKHSQHPLM